MSAVLRALTVLVLTLGTLPVHAQQALEPGPFAPLGGTRLGEPVLFMRAAVLPEIPPVRTRCVPLVDEQGAVLAWLSATAEAGGRVFVRRCVDGPAPEDGVPAGVQRGGEAHEWETAARDDTGALVTTPLGLPDWSFFSNPAFCDARVAYWAFRGGELFVRVYDLDARQELVSQLRGRLDLLADASDTLDAPTWRADCGEVRFLARRLGSRELVFALP